jgi:hypothetical protein
MKNTQATGEAIRSPESTVYHALQSMKLFSLSIFLKVPKCEIFDRSDFSDFYTKKSRREGDFGVKIKKF